MELLKSLEIKRLDQWTVRLSFLLAAGLGGCASLPEVQHDHFSFPKGKAFIGDVKRPYVTLGMVRSEVSFPSLDPSRDEASLCRNYYNQSVKELVKYTEEKGGDAVIDVKSVVFLGDGRQEVHVTPECSDEGDEGQILTQGIAVRWKKEQEIKF